MKISPSLIYQLKKEFRAWYGCLSIEEIMSNRLLIQYIEKIEGHDFFRTAAWQK